MLTFAQWFWLNSSMVNGQICFRYAGRGLFFP